MACLPLDSFQRFVFTLPGDLVTKLAATYTDLQFRFVLNVPYGTGTYLLDRLWLGEQQDSDAGAGGAGSGDAGVPPTGEIVNFVIALPRQVEVHAVGLGANGALLLGDHVTVVDVGGQAVPVTNMGTSGETNIGVEAHVQNLYSRPSVVIRDRGVVEGDALSAGTVTLQECAEADYTGNADPGAGVNQMQDHPPGDITQKGELPPEMVAPPVHELGPYPSLGSQNVCWANLGQSVGWNAVEEPREVNVGNEKWGLFVSPSVAFKGKAAVLPLGGQVNLDARADVGFSAGAYVWGKDVSLINVRATGEIAEGCSVKFDRVVEVFGVAVDPGNEELDVEGGAPAPACTTAMEKRGNLGGALKQALYNAVQVKQYYEQYGATTALCEYTIDAYDPPLFSADCSTEQGRQDAVDFWLDAYQTAYDAVLLNEATIQSAQQALAAALPTQRLPVLDESRHFTAFHYEFTYPVGPATVTVEIELAGSWGASGSLQMHWVPSPGTQLLASGDIHPTADATAFAFAGVGIGPVSFGVSGELLLIGAQAPLVAEVALGQMALPDDRSHTYLDELNLLPAPDFLPTKYSWGGSFTVGARPELEILSGELSLEARVNMVFFKKRFTKKLADWDGHRFGQTYEFLSQPGGNPLGTDVPKLGEWGEDVPYLDPASVSDLAPPTDPQVDTPELPNLVTVCSIIPSGAYAHVNCGNFHCCAIDTRAALACWGSDTYGEAVPPPGQFLQVAAGGDHTCGLRPNGTVECWGFMEEDPPQGVFIEIASGDEHTLPNRRYSRPAPRTAKRLCWHGHPP